MGGIETPSRLLVEFNLSRNFLTESINLGDTVGFIDDFRGLFDDVGASGITVVPLDALRRLNR